MVRDANMNKKYIPQKKRLSEIFPKSLFNYKLLFIKVLLQFHHQDEPLVYEFLYSF